MSGQSGGVHNTGTMNSGGGDIVGGDKHTHNHGLTAEQLVAALKQSQREVYEEARAAGLYPVILALARRLNPDVLQPEQAIIELTDAVEIALESNRRGQHGTNEDAFVSRVLALAAEKTKNTDFDGAAKTVDDAFAEMQRRNADRRDTERREGVAILEAAIRQHTLRRDADAVAARIASLVAVEHATDRPTWHPAFRAHRDGYYEEGETKGVNFSLDIAIACARLMLDAARDPDERGTAAVLLGNALSRLGERESGTARLLDAVAAYRDALLEWTRERVPLEWATTQNNLGNALSILGERESGTARLLDAVAAYRDALLEQTRERVPLGWATTQNNLGNALQTLGERESGTARLLDAVAAYRDALLEWTHERVPLNWAGTQNNLGNALQTLGGRESGTARLLEAVAAYRDALLEWTRERVPLNWATTQNNLGKALRLLGDREGDTGRIQAAVAAWEACLEVTATVWPAEWVASVRAQIDEARGEIARRAGRS